MTEIRPPRTPRAGSPEALVHRGGRPRVTDTEADRQYRAVVVAIMTDPQRRDCPRCRCVRTYMQGWADWPRCEVRVERWTCGHCGFSRQEAGPPRMEVLKVDARFPY